MLLPSSIPNEYYFGDLPGTLQYTKTPQELIDLDLPENNEDCGFQLCEHSLENLNRIVPFTQREKKWKILLMMYKENEEEKWLKAALLNTDTGKIALLTSTDNRNTLEKKGSRAIKTIDGTWFVGFYRMSAPIIFWKELQNRLIYTSTCFVKDHTYL